MKSKKKAISLLLSLAMALACGLTSPVSAAGSNTPGLSMNVNDLLLLDQTEFRLRGWEWGEWDENYTRTVTQTDAATEVIENTVVYALPLGTSVQINYQGSSNRSVQLRAWSDPDGDGIYDQRLFYNSYEDEVYGAVLPASETGPLQESDSVSYFNEVSPWSDNSFDFDGVAIYEPEKISLSSAWLTRLYGADTLICFMVNDTYNEEAQSYNYILYWVYLTGEPADPAVLDAEIPVAVTAGGSLTSDWAVSIISTAESNGLVPNNLYGFDLTGGMTRADFAAVTVNLYEAVSGARITAGEVPFQDLFVGGIGVDNYSSICKAYTMGFVGGTSETTFSPLDGLTREQAAIMLSAVYRALEGDIPSVAATSFADDGAIAGWAKSAVAFSAEIGVVGGVGNNEFAPQRALTAQEAITMAQRMLEYLQ